LLPYCCALSGLAFGSSAWGGVVVVGGSRVDFGFGGLARNISFGTKFVCVFSFGFEPPGDSVLLLLRSMHWHREFGMWGMYYEVYVDSPSCFISCFFSVFVLDSEFNCCFGRVEFPLGVCLWLGWLGYSGHQFRESLRSVCLLGPANAAFVLLRVFFVLDIALPAPGGIYS
jgi:hypothetical protein